MKNQELRASQCKKGFPFLVKEKKIQLENNVHC